MNVVIVMSRCSRTKKFFGMRFEEKDGNLWVTDWAFPIKEETGKKEGYDRGKISGKFYFSQEYPGCPYCGAKGIFQCIKCGGKTACWDTSETEVICPNCNTKLKLSGEIQSMSSGVDR